MANRYTNITPAKFNPLSMDEVMFPAMQMRQNHDLALDKAIEMEALDSNRLSQDDEAVSGIYGALRGKLEDVSKGLASSGWSGKTKNDLSSIRREYAQAMSPTGVAGRAQKNYMQANADWDLIQKSQIQRGAPPNFLRNAKKYFFEGEYQGVGGEDGVFNDFQAGNVPNYYDVPQEMADYFSEVGIMQELTRAQGGVQLAQGPDGVTILIDKNPAMKTDNLAGLNAALNRLRYEYTDPNQDKGFSAALQGYTPNDIEQILVMTAESYRQQQLTPANDSFQPIYDRTTGDTTGGSEVTMPWAKSTNTGGNVALLNAKSRLTKGGTRGIISNNAANVLVSSSQSKGYGTPSKPVAGLTPIPGKVWVSRVSGVMKGHTTKYSNKSKSISGVSIKDAKLMGYVQSYTLKSVDMIANRDETLRKDQKLHDEIQKLTRAGETGEGSLFTVNGADEITSLPNLKAGWGEGEKPLIMKDEKGLYVIYPDGDASVRVNLEPILLKHQQGIVGDKTGTASEISSQDYINVFSKATREEALRDRGMDANISAPIAVEWGEVSTSGQLRELFVLPNQPFVSDNSSVSLLHKADLALESFSLYMNNVMEGTASPELAGALTSYGVNIDDVITDWMFLNDPAHGGVKDANGNTKTVEEMGGTVMQVINAMLKENRNGFEGDRYGGQIYLNRLQEKSLNNILQFLSVLEYLELPEDE